MTLTLSMTASDGSRVYLRDDPDGVVPRPTVDPFRARPFVDRAAVEAYLMTHPECDRPDVLVVPWPVDLDRAVYIEPPDDRELPSAAPVIRSARPEPSRPLFESLDGRAGAADRHESQEIVT